MGITKTTGCSMSSVASAVATLRDLKLRDIWNSINTRTGAPPMLSSAGRTSAST